MNTRISFNGHVIEVPAGTLAALLARQGCDPAGAMACAVNGQFVPRGRWPAHTLCDGDRVDVVAPVTGG